MQKRIIRRAAVSGLAGALAAMADVPAVFAREPGEDFENSGSAWVGKVSQKYEFRALGNGPWNMSEHVTVEIEFQAYCEAGSSQQAAEDAEDRVDDMLSAFLAWLQSHQGLEGTDGTAFCSWTEPPEGSGESLPYQSGWVHTYTLRVTAVCHPPFTG